MFDTKHHLFVKGLALSATFLWKVWCWASPLIANHILVLFLLFGYLVLISINIDYACEYDNCMYGNENICYDYVYNYCWENFKYKFYMVVMFSVCFNIWVLKKLVFWYTISHSTHIQINEVGERMTWGLNLELLVFGHFTEHNYYKCTPTICIWIIESRVNCYVCFYEF